MVDVAAAAPLTILILHFRSLTPLTAQTARSQCNVGTTNFRGTAEIETVLQKSVNCMFYLCRWILDYVLHIC